MSALRSTGLSHGEVAAEDKHRESAPQERRPADESLIRSFEEQMAEARASSPPHTSPHISETNAMSGTHFAEMADASPPTPASLFGAVSRTVHPDIKDLTHDLGKMLTGLRVGESGAQPMVEMDVDESLLPGATIRLSESEGRLQVDFTCRDEAVRLHLNGQAVTMATTLHERLQRPVLVRVQSDDRDHPQVTEALEA